MKFTCEIEENDSISFLDCLITRNGDKLDTSNGDKLNTSNNVQS